MLLRSGRLRSAVGIGDLDPYAVTAVGDDQLAGQPGVRLDAVGELEQLALLVRRLVEPSPRCGVEVPRAGRARAPPAAFGDDAGQVVADGSVHHALPARHVDLPHGS